ncbi:hypothetical protein SAMN04490181_3570 [Pseudomonas brenneri]|uniref:Uncharacterized protein n=1 Tax=Pseudomonas brenneri TaxID=129817 RepID=A0ABY0WFS8_9PSED|nr:hypothetical protein [Pseudomonas sp. 25 R 14]SDV04517.1 hypothetical protein SAMN04490181_3570 [Pseudomonas brenneri]
MAWAIFKAWIYIGWTGLIAGKPGSHIGIHFNVGAGLARDEAISNTDNP